MTGDGVEGEEAKAEDVLGRGRRRQLFWKRKSVFSLFSLPRPLNRLPLAAHPPNPLRNVLPRPFLQRRRERRRKSGNGPRTVAEYTYNFCQKGQELFVPRFRLF